MTVNDVLAVVAQHLDAVIATELQNFEATLRRDDPDAPWRCVTIEEALIGRHQQLAAWRAARLTDLRPRIVAIMVDHEVAREAIEIDERFDAAQPALVAALRQQGVDDKEIPEVLGDAHAM